MVRSSLLALLVATSAAAQAPRLLSLQGRLADTSGAPLTAPTTLTARLYDHVTTGTLVHTEVQVVAPDERGTFVTTLGDDALLDEADFGQPLWAELETEGTTLTPRIALTAAPYALRAAGLDPAAPVAMNSQRLTDLADPSAAQDAVTRAYLEGEPFGPNIFLARDSAHLQAILSALDVSGAQAIIYLGGQNYSLSSTPIPDDVALIGGGTEGWGLGHTLNAPFRRQAGSASGVAQLDATTNITFSGTGRNLFQGLSIQAPIVLNDGTDLTLSGCTFEGISGGGSSSEVHLISSSSEEPISLPDVSALILQDSMTGPITVAAGTPEVFLRSSSVFGGLTSLPSTGIDLSDCTASSSTRLSLHASQVHGPVALPAGAQHALSFTLFTRTGSAVLIAPTPSSTSICVQVFDDEKNALCP